MRFGKLSNWIDGKFANNANAIVHVSVYPATLESIYNFEQADADRVDQAVVSALRAQKEWAKTTGTERGKILMRAAQVIRDSCQELAEMEVYDTGKPISEAIEVDIPSAADALEYFAGIAPSITGEHYHLGNDFAYTIKEPLGVVAGIGAWNYPLQIACWKSAPALASGNAMIYKPSEKTNLTAIRLAQIFAEAGLPNGLFNVLLGDGTVGELLCKHPSIDKITLTGSVNTGKKVLKLAADTVKHTTLELGGKSPLIVFDDAHLDKAVQAALDANFYTQGEVCSNGTRVFVHESIFDTFKNRLVEATEALLIGDPMDAATQVGALIDKAHMENVLSYIAKGQAEGAKLLCGGKRFGDEGCFVEPTIFGNCRDEMCIVQEEIFGPVLSLLSFSDESEVIQRANATQFGLAAGVFTNDLQRGHRMARELEAGICWLNTYNLTPIEIPFGGYKQSGIGRENSRHAIDHFTQLKTVYVAM